MASGEVRAGRATLTAPATARIRVRAAGRKDAMKSIFVDTPGLLQPTLEIQQAAILDWSTYEQIRKTLSQIQLRFTMEASA
jgi:GTPase Era involved in 16S rRNA processing